MDAVFFGMEIGAGLLITAGIWRAFKATAAGIKEEMDARTRRKRLHGIAKNMQKDFIRHVRDPLDGYEYALKDLQNLKEFLTEGLICGDYKDTILARETLKKAEDVVKVCERAHRIDEIADKLHDISLSEFVQKMVDDNDPRLNDWVTSKYSPHPRSLEAKIGRVDRIFRARAKIEAAKSGPLNWVNLNDRGPHGQMGLKPNLIADAEAELDGYRHYTDEEVKKHEDTWSGVRVMVAEAAMLPFDYEGYEWMKG
jgi:hypothetical protein